MNIVIIGGGFAGVKAALELSKRHVGQITLISDESYFLHHATLYATATGKNIAESVISLKDIFVDHPDVSVIKDKIESINPKNRTLQGKKKQYHYDEVIFALGSVTTYFGIKGLAQHSYGIKSLSEIREFKDHIHTEAIEGKLDKEYFVVGAGSTGVELAAALQEHINYLKNAYRIKGAVPHVTLVEAAKRILPHASLTASKLVSKQLKKLGIRVLVNHRVDALNKDSISIEGRTIPTKTAVWTSGVANNPFFAANEAVFQLANDKRVIVNEYLQAAPHIFVIGDNNTVQYSGTAWPAMQQANYTAKYITKKIARLPVKPFHPRKYPFGIPIGESWGYVEWKGIYVAGRTGFMVRRLIELQGFCQLLPLKKAIVTWRAHDLPQVDA